jgi:hypothetical protein
MRRLAWHRSWFTVGLGVFMLVFPVSFTVEMFFTSYGDEPAAWLVPFVAIPFCLLIIVRGLVGSWSKNQLRVDIPAGVLRLERGKLVPLAEVGEVTIAKRRDTYGKNRSVWYQLKIAALPELVLFESPFEDETQKRYDALQSAVIQAALRPILERPIEGVAFRATPEIDDEVVRVAGSEDRARTALVALTADHDQTIRERASQLLRGARLAGPR